MATNTFSMTNVTLSLAGDDLIKAVLTDNDAVSIEAPERVTGKNSIGGGGAIAQNSNTELTIKVKLLSTEPLNDALADLMALVSNGTAVAETLILSVAGGTLLVDGQFVPKKAPNITLGSEVPVYEWELYSPNANYYAGAIAGA